MSYQLSEKKRSHRDRHPQSPHQCGAIGGGISLANRPAAMEALGKDAWKPAQPRQRRVSAALKAYALLATSADRGAVRNLELLE